MKIIADAHIPFVKDYFSHEGDLVLKSGRTISPADVNDADILLVRSITHVDKKLLGNARVKFVGSVTAGHDHLDTKWLDEAGISWSTAAGFNAPPVADYIVSTVAALEKTGYLSSAKRKAAVIGVGNAGRLVVERLKQLNFEVILCDPIRAAHEPDFQSVSFQALADVDLISLHVPLTKVGEHPTYHFIDKDFLIRQKPGCILINASRGSVINTDDLLTYGAHLRWCFDVWEHEPNIAAAVLARALLATPHIAGYSIQSKIRGIDMIYRIACEKKLIAPSSFSPLTMPEQHLTFARHDHDWQDIILGIFNPLVITAMMRTVLLPEPKGTVFDEMRNQFNYRHEFSYTTISESAITQQEQQLIQRLGVRVG